MTLTQELNGFIDSRKSEGEHFEYENGEVEMYLNSLGYGSHSKLYDIAASYGMVTKVVPSIDRKESVTVLIFDPEKTEE